MKTKIQLLALFLSPAVLVILGILIVGSATASPVSAPSAEIHVCPTMETGCDHTSIQAAVDAAAPGSVIKVAAGFYSGPHVREGTTQTVHIDKSLSLLGGYTPVNWTVSQPAVNMTTIDGLGQGATILVTNTGPVNINGLHITGAGTPAVVFLDWAAGILAGKSVVDISNCTIDHNYSGVLLWETDATLTSNLVFSNTLESQRSTGGAGVSLWHSTATLTGNTIRDNVVRSTAVHGGGGGAFYAYFSTATLVDNTIDGNVANEIGIGEGGALYFEESNGAVTGNTITGNSGSTINMGLGRGGAVYLIDSAVAINDNIINDNKAATAPGGNGRGGGLYIILSDGTTLTGNQIRGNVASEGRIGSGGGIVVDSSEVTLTANIISDNIAGASPNTYPGYGGGLAMEKSTLEWRTMTLFDNTISGNVAATTGSGEGGGLYLELGSAKLYGNQIVSNTASTGLDGQGGGIYVMTGGTGPFTSNIISGNVASTVDEGFGGGIYLDFADGLSLDSNTIIGNASTLGSGATSQGGGVWMSDTAPMTMTNNLVAGNRAYSEGSGLWFDGFPYCPPIGVLMLHNTLADNDGCGQGMHVGDTAILTLTNNIVSGHSDVGIRVSTGSTVTMEATLWYSNSIDLDNAGLLSPGTINVYEDPAFVGGGDYHLTADSEARDKGVPCGVTKDIDGHPRPVGPAVDLGFDEYAVFDYPSYLPGVTK